MEKEMNLAELHCHTIYSNDHKPRGMTESYDSPEDYLKAAKARGLSAIAITDHNSYTGSEIAQELASKYGIVVIPAIEFNTNEGEHILAYGVKNNIKPFRSAKEIIDDIHANGGIAVMAHPFDILCGSKDPLETVKLADGIEVLNHCVTGNGKALRFAKEQGVKLRIAGADAHTTKLVGSVVNKFPDSCKSAEDYLNAMREGKVKAIPQIGYFKSLFIAGIDLLNRSRTRNKS